MAKTYKNFEKLYYRREPESGKKVLFAFFAPTDKTSKGRVYNTHAIRVESEEEMAEIEKQLDEQLTKLAAEKLEDKSPEKITEFIAAKRVLIVDDYTNYKYPEVTSIDDVKVKIESVVLDQYAGKMYVHFENSEQKSIELPATAENFLPYATKWFKEIEVETLFDEVIAAGDDLSKTDIEEIKADLEKVEDPLNKKLALLNKYNELKGLDLAPSIAFVDAMNCLVRSDEKAKSEVQANIFEEKQADYEHVLDVQYEDINENFERFNKAITNKRFLTGAGVALGIVGIFALLNNNEEKAISNENDVIDLLINGIDVNADNVNDWIAKISETNPEVGKFLTQYLEDATKFDAIVDRLGEVTKPDGTKLYSEAELAEMMITPSQYLATMVSCGQVSMDTLAQIVNPLAASGVEISWLNEDGTINRAEFDKNVKTTYMKSIVYLGVMTEDEYDLFDNLLGGETRAADLARDLNKTIHEGDSEKFAMLFTEGAIPANGFEAFVFNVYGMFSTATFQLDEYEGLSPAINVKDHVMDGVKTTKFAYVQAANNDACVTIDKNIDAFEDSLVRVQNERLELIAALEIYQEMEIHIQSGTKNPYFHPDGQQIAAKDLPAAFEQLEDRILKTAKNGAEVGTYVAGVMNYIGEAYGKHMGDMNVRLADYINNELYLQYAKNEVKHDSNYVVIGGETNKGVPQSSGSTSVPSGSTSTSTTEEPANDIISETGQKDDDAKDKNDPTVKDGDTIKVTPEEPKPTPGPTGKPTEEPVGTPVPVGDPSLEGETDDKGKPVEDKVVDPTNPNNDQLVPDDVLAEIDQLTKDSDPSYTGDGNEEPAKGNGGITVTPEGTTPVTPDPKPASVNEEVAATTSVENTSVSTPTVSEPVTTPVATAAPAIQVEVGETTPVIQNVLSSDEYAEWLYNAESSVPETTVDEQVEISK